jgi:hypothetical protein
MVGIQEAFWRCLVDHLGQLPSPVHRILYTDIEARAGLGRGEGGGIPRDVRVNLVRPPTPATTTQVGARREAPVILTVDAAAMHAAGHAFYQAANGVWLTRPHAARLPVGLAG